MSKAKWSEVPKEYRRNYKKEIINVLKVFGSCLVIIVILMLIILGFN